MILHVKATMSSSARRLLLFSQKLWTKCVTICTEFKKKHVRKNKCNLCIAYPWHIHISLNNVYKNECRPYRLCSLSRAICDEHDRENSRFDLAWGAHECLRSRGMQMCHGLRQATWPHAVRSGARQVGGCASCLTCFLFGGTPKCNRGTNLWLITRPRWGHAGGKGYLRILTTSRIRIACRVVQYNVRNSDETHHIPPRSSVFGRNTSSWHA